MTNNLSKEEYDYIRKIEKFEELVHKMGLENDRLKKQLSEGLADNNSAISPDQIYKQLERIESKIEQKQEMGDFLTDDEMQFFLLCKCDTIFEELSKSGQDIVELDKIENDPEKEYIIRLIDGDEEGIETSNFIFSKIAENQYKLNRK